MTRRLTVIVVVILGILAAVQVEAEAQVPQTIGVLPSVNVGNGPQGTAFDRATDTVYVANQGDNTVSVVDARHCNSLDTSGCAQTPATVPTGSGAFSIAIDDATHTVYVDNQDDNTISVIDAATCNGQNIRAAQTPVPDDERRTRAVRHRGRPANRHDLCRRRGGRRRHRLGDQRRDLQRDTTGCGQQPATVTVGNFPFGILVDRRDHTVYVTNAADNTVSMIDRRTCNATNTSGCAEPRHRRSRSGASRFRLPSTGAPARCTSAARTSPTLGRGARGWPDDRRHRRPDLQRAANERLRPGDTPTLDRSGWHRRHVDRRADRDAVRLQQRARREPGAVAAASR